MDHSRRTTIQGLLALLSTAGVPGCSGGSSDDPDPPGTTPLLLDAERLEGLFTSLLTGTPWADRDVVGEFEQGLDKLREAGLEDTAELFTTIANQFIGGGLEIAAAPDDSAFLYAFRDALVGTLGAKEDIGRLAASAKSELQSLNGGSDTIAAADLSGAVELLVDQEKTLRQWLHEEGRSGDATQNLLLNGLAQWRNDGTMDQSIELAADNLTAAINGLGELDPSVYGLLPRVARANGPAAPPEAWEDACTALALLGIVLAPFAAGASMGATASTDDLIEAAIEGFLGSGSTAAEALGSGMLGADPCDTMAIVIQLVAQALSFAMALVAIGMLCTVLTGPMGWLLMLFLLFQVVMTMLGAVCTVASAIKSSIEYAQCAA